MREGGGGRVDDARGRLARRGVRDTESAARSLAAPALILLSPLLTTPNAVSLESAQYRTLPSSSRLATADTSELNEA